MQTHDTLHTAKLYEERECDCRFFNADSVKSETRNVVVDLMAIAKPAKVKGMTSQAIHPHDVSIVTASCKGVAKDFEIVKRVKDVIALEDSMSEISDLDLGDDEWEEIEYELGFKEKRTYSAALRGR
jgi:hypothetical protein